MASYTIYPPPKDTQKSDGLGAPLSEHYFTPAAQQTGKQSYAYALTDAEAQEVIDYCLDTTRLHLQHVKEKPCSHGDLIMKRWGKYSHVRRAAVLRAAWSGISGDWLFVGAHERDPIPDPWGSKAASIAAIKWLNSRNLSA
jgi:hypothetical protein